MSIHPFHQLELVLPQPIVKIMIDYYRPSTLEIIEKVKSCTGQSSSSVDIKFEFFAISTWIDSLAGLEGPLKTHCDAQVCRLAVTTFHYQMPKMGYGVKEGELTHYRINLPRQISKQLADTSFMKIASNFKQMLEKIEGAYKAVGVTEEAVKKQEKEPVELVDADMTHKVQDFYRKRIAKS